MKLTVLSLGCRTSGGFAGSRTSGKVERFRKDMAEEHRERGGWPRKPTKEGAEGGRG